MSKDNYMPYDNVDVAKRIIELRLKKGWSSYMLSLKSGISNSVLIRIEKTEREPKINTLLKIISGLNMSPNEFFMPFTKIE